MATEKQTATVIPLTRDDAMPAIERDVPVPKLGNKVKSGTWTGFFGKMNIGDSAFFPGRKATDIGARAIGASKNNGHKFTVRSIDGGTRIWRIK